MNPEQPFVYLFFKIFLLSVSPNYNLVYLLYILVKGKRLQFQCWVNVRSEEKYPALFVQKFFSWTDWLSVRVKIMVISKSALLTPHNCLSVQKYPKEFSKWCEVWRHILMKLEIMWSELTTWGYFSSNPPTDWHCSLLFICNIWTAQWQCMEPFLSTNTFDSVDPASK